MNSTLVLLSLVRALIGVLMIEEDDKTDGSSHENGRANTQDGGIAPVLEWGRVETRQLDDLDVAVGWDLDGIGRVRDRVDGAVPLADVAAVDGDIRVWDLEERVLEWENAVELQAAHAADEAHVWTHSFVATNIQMTW